MNKRIRERTGRFPKSDTETTESYYRARYYDASTSRFLSEDPISFMGGNHFYQYGLNRATTLVDPLGLDGHTWGPITIYTNQQGMTPTQIKAEQAHERQHRCDFWNGNVFTKPCEDLESRGFAAEIPILQQRIDDLRNQKTLTIADRQELQQLLQELELANGMSDPSGLMIRVYCHRSGPLNPPSPQYPTPPRCGGFTCLDNR